MRNLVFIVNFEHSQLNMDLFFFSLLTFSIHLPATHICIMTEKVQAVIPKGRNQIEKGQKKNIDDEVLFWVVPVGICFICQHLLLAVLHI